MIGARGRRRFGWVVALLTPLAAEAQLWDPLELIPPPNTLLGFDTSVSMLIGDRPIAGLTTECGYRCHIPPNQSVGNRSPASYGLTVEETRLGIARTHLRTLLPIFKDKFNFGGFEYSSCVHSKLLQYVLPHAEDTEVSLAGLEAMLDQLTVDCGRTELEWPPEFEAAARDVCLTPGCVNDAAKIDALLISRTQGIPGTHFIPPLTVTCDLAPNVGQVRDMLPSLTRLLYSRALMMGGIVEIDRYQAGHFGERTWTNYMNHTLQDELRDCLAALTSFGYHTTAPRDVGEMFCEPGYWGEDTCICNNRYRTDPSCFRSGQILLNACGTPVSYPLRHRYAMCEMQVANDGRTPLQDFFASQPENIVNINQNPGACRENISLFLTDGFAGGRERGLIEETNKFDDYFLDKGGIPNLYVLHPSDSFASQADLTSRVFSDEVRRERIDIRDESQVMFGLTEILNRVQAGIYSSATPSANEPQDRLATVSFSIHGETGPGLPNARYFGRPMRLSFQPIARDGTIGAPIFETDWDGIAGSVGARQAERNPVRYLCPGADQVVEADPGAASPCGANDVQYFGPYGEFGNGVSRERTVPANRVDRDGNRSADQHPKLRLGMVFGPASSRPVIVERPFALASSANPSFFDFLASDALALRPRVVYFLSNEYLHAIHAGEPRSLGGYEDDPNQNEAGREIFRYRPPGLDTRPEASLNNVLPQKFIRGQLTVREVEGAYPAETGADAHATLLAFSQGESGNAYSVLDVTNPFTPRVYRERVVPSGSSASDPNIYRWPSAFQPRTAMIPFVTGEQSLHLWDIVNDTLTSVPLTSMTPDEYWTAPSCIATKTGHLVSVCYLLGRFGTLWRIPVVDDGVGAPVNVTPTGAGEATVRGDGREYWAAPTVYFDQENQLSIAFGSGNPRVPREHPGMSTQNRFFRLLDPGSGTLSARSVCVADAQGATLGQFELGERQLMAPPTVRRGILSFTTYSPKKYCADGTAHAYAVRAGTCADALSGADRPAGLDLGPGLPKQPLILHRSGKVVYQTVLAISGAGQVERSAPTMATRRFTMRMLFWRHVSQVQ